MAICHPFESMVAIDQPFEVVPKKTRLCNEKFLKFFFTLLSAEKHMYLVLALQARLSPNTQDQAGRLNAATGHLFEVTSFTWHCGESPRSKLQIPKTAEHHFLDKQ